MPKMKTKSSAKKRFRVRPGGTVKRGQAFKCHILTKKTTKNKRHLRGAVNVHETNMGHMAHSLRRSGARPRQPRPRRHAAASVHPAHHPGHRLQNLTHTRAQAGA